MARRCSLGRMSRIPRARRTSISCRSRPTRPQAPRSLHLASTRKRSKEPATEEHALVELQLKPYAYWHVMKRRLLDYVQLGTHAEVCTATVEWRLRQHLAHAIDECPNLVELMSSDEKRVQQLKERSRDLERLRVASAWIKEVRARVRERGASVGAS